MCKTPCDIKNLDGKYVCPYANENSITGTYFCRDHCGLGCDENFEDPDYNGEFGGDDDIDESMNPYAGMTGTVTGIKICGHLQLTVDNGSWCWADEMLEPVEKPTPKVKKEKLPMTKYGFTIGQKVVYRGEVREVIAFGKRSETLYVRLEGTPICEPSLADRPVKVKWMIVKPFEVTKFEKKKRPARRFTDEEIKEASVIISNLLVYYGNARTIKITEKGNATEVLVMRNMEITSGVSKNGRGDIYSPTIGLMIAMCRAFGQDRLIPKWIFK